MTTQSQQDNFCLATTSPDDLLRRFWEVEDYNLQQPLLSSEEQVVVNHFEKNYSKVETGRFIVPLPMKNQLTLLGESRSLAVKRFKALEHSLAVRSQFKEFVNAVNEYLDMEHAEFVPVADLSKPCKEVYSLLCTRCVTKQVLPVRCGSCSTNLPKLHPVRD